MRMLAIVHTTFKYDSQIKKGELTWATAMFVHESASKVATKDGAKIVIRHLRLGQQMQESYRKDSTSR